MFLSLFSCVFEGEHVDENYTTFLQPEGPLSAKLKKMFIL
jgi:hypothetical protein